MPQRHLLTFPFFYYTSTNAIALNVGKICCLINSSYLWEYLKSLIILLQARWLVAY